jgi:hypothetical protein
MKNNFPLATPGIYSDAFAVTPDDEADLAQRPQALWIGSTGDLALTMPSGDITLLAVPAGTEIRISPIRVLEATTADDIVALV